MVVGAGGGIERGGVVVVVIVMVVGGCLEGFILPSGRTAVSGYMEGDNVRGKFVYRRGKVGRSWWGIVRLSERLIRHARGVEKESADVE